MKLPLMKRRYRVSVAGLTIPLSNIELIRTLHVSFLVLTVAFSAAPTLACMSEVMPRPVTDPDTYRLVFPTSPNVDEFGEQLNKAGEQGYRLLSVMYRSQRFSGFSYYRAPVAILKRDSVQHEYAWFKTNSRRAFHFAGFDQEYGKLSKQGFHLIDFLVDHACPDTDYEGNCKWEYNALFLLHRENAMTTPLRFMVARSVLHRTGIKGEEITQQIKTLLADGLYPTRVFSKFEILLTQRKNDDLSPGNSDVRVVVNTFPHDVKGKIKDLAQQGYRLLLVSSGIAVMYKRPGSAAPVTYEWVDADKGDFEKRLLELQRRGAAYRMIYLNRDLTTKEQLIFELGAADEPVQREYKVLRFEFQDVKDAAGTRVQIDLTPSSKETVKLMNDLAKQGFVVRELFKSKTVSVLLERSR